MPPADDRPRYRFRPDQRLHERPEFDRAFDEGQRAAGRDITVHAVPNGLAHCRLGVAIGRAAGGAVQRNRIRRRIREAFRLAQHDLPEAHDLVVVVRRSWSDPTPADLRTELIELAGKALARGRHR